MRELNWGKRPIEEHDNARLPENTKRRRGDNSASTGFASGEAGRRHFLFTDIAQKQERDLTEVYHQAGRRGPLTLLEQVEQGQVTLTRQSEVTHQTGPSDHLKLQDQVEQPQTTLGEDLYILGQKHYEVYKHIQAMNEKYQAGLNNLVTRDFLMPLDQKQAIQIQQDAGPSRQGDTSSRSDHLELSTDDFEFGSIELRNPHDQTQVTSPQSFPEIRHPFAAHHPAEAQRANVRRQDTLVQQYEGHNQAGSNDYNRDAADREQILQSFERHKQMRKYSLNSTTDSNIGISFINSLPNRYMQAYKAYRDRRYNSKEGEAIYQLWSEVYTGVSWKHQQEIARDVNWRLEQHDAQWLKKNQQLEEYNRQWGESTQQQTKGQTSRQQTRRQG